MCRDKIGWTRSYEALMAHNVEALIGSVEIATAMSVIVQAAGDLILLTRDIVRGVIADLFADVIVWTVDTSTPASRQITAVRLGCMLTASWHIHADLTALASVIRTGPR